MMPVREYRSLPFVPPSFNSSHQTFIRTRPKENVSQRFVSPNQLPSPSFYPTSISPSQETKPDYMALLDELIKKKHFLPPVYKTTNLFSQKYPNKPLRPSHAGQYVCNLTVSDDLGKEVISIKTFPKVFPTGHQAMAEAAEKAYYELKARGKLSQVISYKLCVTINLIMVRLMPLIGMKIHLAFHIPSS